MVQYPEGREQYCRLLNVVTEIQEKKVSTRGPIDFDEDLIDVEALVEYDTFMATATRDIFKTADNKINLPEILEMPANRWCERMHVSPKALVSHSPQVPSRIVLLL
ncbi:hypothetical protein SLE2022_366710 [Rubroshorea leprosula]